MYPTIVAMRTCLCLWLLLLACSCSLNTSNDGLVSPEALKRLTCTHTSDCSDGRNCQHGLCVDGPTDVEIHASVTIVPPPNRDDIGPVSYRNVDIKLQNTLTVSLARTVTINGIADEQDGTLSGPVRLFFSRNGDLPDHVYTSNTTTDEHGNFTIQLPTGSYTVSMQTSWEDFPEHITTLNVSREFEGSMVHLSLPPQNAFIRWTGRLIRLDETHTTQPVSGVTLWATSPAVKGTSSIAETDSDGAFSFYLSRSATTFQIHVRGRSAQHDGRDYVIPTTTFAPMQVSSSSQEASSRIIPGYELTLGVIKPSVNITGVVVDASGTPVPQARVLAQSHQQSADMPDALNAPVRTTIEQSATTDEKGRFTIPFPPRPNVRLTAFDTQNGPRISDASRRIDLTEAAPASAYNVVLSIQDPEELELHVSDASGTPIENFKASFDLQDGKVLSSHDYAVNLKAFASVFQFPNDTSQPIEIPTGLWHLHITPRRDLTLPQIWLLQPIDAEHHDLTVNLPPGIAGKFIIEDDTGAPVRGATINLWGESNDNAAPHLLGTAQSDANGNAVMVLPYIEQRVVGAQ